MTATGQPRWIFEPKLLRKFPDTILSLALLWHGSLEQASLYRRQFRKATPLERQAMQADSFRFEFVTWKRVIRVKQPKVLHNYNSCKLAITFLFLPDLGSMLLNESLHAKAMQCFYNSMDDPYTRWDHSRKEGNSRKSLAFGPARNLTRAKLFIHPEIVSVQHFTFQRCATFHWA